jgi:hypothetical protein
MPLEMNDARENELVEMSGVLVEFLKCRGLDPAEATGVLLTAVLTVYRTSNFDLSVEEMANRVRQTLIAADKECNKLNVSH